MLGRYKFRKGERVRPSAESIAARLFPKTRHDQSGVVIKVNNYNCPTILWAGRKMPREYHPDFIAPDRRRKSKQRS